MNDKIIISHGYFLTIFADATISAPLPSNPLFAPTIKATDHGSTSNTKGIWQNRNHWNFRVSKQHYTRTIAKLFSL